MGILNERIVEERRETNRANELKANAGGKKTPEDPPAVSATDKGKGKGVNGLEEQGTQQYPAEFGG